MGDCRYKVPREMPLHLHEFSRSTISLGSSIPHHHTSGAMKNQISPWQAQPRPFESCTQRSIMHDTTLCGTVGSIPQQNSMSASMELHLPNLTVFLIPENQSRKILGAHPKRAHIVPNVKVPVPVTSAQKQLYSSIKDVEYTSEYTRNQVPREHTHHFRSRTFPQYECACEHVYSRLVRWSGSVPISQ